MKRIAIVHVSIPPDARKYWEDHVHRYVLNADWHEPLNREKGKVAIYCDIDTQDDRYAAFLTFLEENGLKLPSDRSVPGYEERYLAALHSKGVTWSIIRIEHIYTDEELRSFPLLDLRVDRKEIGPYGPNYGTTYDFSMACPKCGTGVVQTSPFYAPANSFPKKGLLCSSSTEKFVATPLAEALREANVSGLELCQACDHRHRAGLPWWQIISTFEMPRMGPTTKGIICSESLPPCPVCGRDGHYDKSDVMSHEIIYDGKEVSEEAVPDVVCSWERFGRSVLNTEDMTRSRFAEPLILVKPKVFDIFRKLKVQHSRFGPVRIE